VPLLCRKENVIRINTCILLQACNRKLDTRRTKSKNKQKASHVEVVRLLLDAIFKLRDAPVEVEDKQPAAASSGVTMDELGVDA
jgi:hypothetical protein